MNEELNLSVWQPITALNVVNIAVNNVLDELCGIGRDTDGLPKSQEEYESESKTERGPSLASYITLAKALRAELVSLAAIDQAFGNWVRMGRVEGVRNVLDLEIEVVEQLRKERSRQTKLHISLGIKQISEPVCPHGPKPPSFTSKTCHLVRACPN